MQRSRLQRQRGEGVPVEKKKRRLSLVGVSRDIERTQRNLRTVVSKKETALLSQ